MKTRVITAFAVSLLALSFSVSAEISFTINAERTTVAMGETVNVTATLRSSRNLGSLPSPSIGATDALDLIGSSQRTSQSIHMELVNGKMVQKPDITHTFIYNIRPRKTGRVTIPPVQIEINGHTYSTKPLVLNVTEQKVQNPDIRVSLLLNKRTLYPGEQALLTLKVSQRAGSQIQVQRGFQSAVERMEKVFESDFSLSRLFTNQITSGSERINGELYNTYSLNYALFPLKPGEFPVHPIMFEYDEIRRTQRGRIDPLFQDFFGSDFFGGTHAIKQSAYSNALTITVNPLPHPAPGGFRGSVGKFTINSSISSKEVPAGEALTLSVTLRGNTRPSNTADPVLPDFKNFETFTPERRIHVDTTESGLSTRKTYSYVLIPGTEGNLTLDPILYNYFDPQTGSFKTAATEPISVVVTRGAARKAQTRYLTQEEIRQVGEDIRYIKTALPLRHEYSKPHRQLYWYLLFALPFLLTVAALFYRAYLQKLQKNSLLITRQKALKAAKKSINELKKHKSSISVSDLLSRISLVVERYISQKFGFAATGRTLEELKNELLSNNVNEKTVNGLTDFMEQIAQFRFGGQNLDENSKETLLNDVGTFIENLEKNCSKEKKPIKVALFSLFILCALSPATLASEVQSWFELGNDHYNQEQFDSAEVYYTKIIESGLNSSTVLYNLGNVYYRQGMPGKARLHYERASLLNPSDPDISANLSFIKTVLIDRVPESENSIVASILSGINSFLPLKQQLKISFYLLLSISVLLSFALLSADKKRAWLLSLSFIPLLMLLFIAPLAGYNIYQLEKKNYAVVITQSADANNQPDGSKLLFTAHEGTKLLIRRSTDLWSLVSLPNGISGWMKNEYFEKI